MVGRAAAEAEREMRLLELFFGDGIDRPSVRSAWLGGYFAGYSSGSDNNLQYPGLGLRKISRRTPRRTPRRRPLRFHLGLPSMPTVLKSSNNGENASKSRPCRQYRRENARNHQGASASGMAHRKSADGPFENEESYRRIPLARCLLLQVFGRRQMDLQKTDSSLGSYAHLCAKTSVHSERPLSIERGWQPP